MMAAEADAWGFYTARKKVFLGGGLGYNRTIQKRWFPGFVPIADFVHVVEYGYTAAKAMHADVPSRWRQYVAWATACRQGRVEEVLEELRPRQSRLGPLPPSEELPRGGPTEDRPRCPHVLHQ